MMLVYNKSRAWLKSVLLMLLIVNLGACVGYERWQNPIKNHTKQDVFNYHNILNHGIAVAGGTLAEPIDEDRDQIVVTPLTGALDIQSRIVDSLWVSDSLQSRLKRERKSYMAVGPEELIDAIPAERYVAMLKQHRAERWVDPIDLKLIRESIQQRFVAFVSVEPFSTYRRSTCSMTIDWRAEQEKDESERKAVEKYELIRILGQKTAASIDIFDLVQGIIVWSGSDFGGWGNSETYTMDYCNDSDDWELSWYSYPSYYPAKSQTLFNLMQNFVLHMPTKRE